MTETCRQLLLAIAICLIACRPSLAQADDPTLEEASSAAGKIVRAKVLKLKDGTFMGYHNFGAGSETFWQFHSFAWRLQTVARTLADTLNRVSWKGRIDSKIDAYRFTSSAVTGSSKSRCWKPWEDIKGSSSQFGWSLWDENGVWKNELVSAPEAVGGDRAPKTKDAERALKFPKCKSS